jgi:hypothetical protein
VWLGNEIKCVTGLGATKSKNFFFAEMLKDEIVTVTVNVDHDGVKENQKNVKVLDKRTSMRTICCERKTDSTHELERDER